MKRSLGILALAALLPAVAWGQSASLAPGARVRVTSPSDNLKRHVSTVTEMRGDSIVMSGSTGSRTVALGNVTALDVSTGKRRNVGRYALIGLGAGTLLGVTAGVAAKDDCEEAFNYCVVPVDAGFAGVMVLATGAVGLVTGAIAGALHQTDRWEKHPGIRAAIAPSALGGVTLSVSKAF